MHTRRQGWLVKVKKLAYTFGVEMSRLQTDAQNVYGHITLKIPVLVRSLKSSNVEPG